MYNQQELKSAEELETEDREAQAAVRHSILLYINHSELGRRNSKNSFEEGRPAIWLRRRS